MEKVSDIVREMREEAREDCYTPDGLHGQSLNYYADRIEAAHDREMAVSKMETTTKENLGVGNAAKMREALILAVLRLSKKGVSHLFDYVFAKAKEGAE